MSTLVYICSSNPGKLNEFRLAAQSHSSSRYTVELLPGLDQIDPPAEVGTTFEQNATSKAIYYSRFTPELVFSDDSGLEVDALSGAPGVYSARYAGPAATDSANNKLLLARLSGVEERTACFTCVLSLCRDGNVLRTFRGTVSGKILLAPQGQNGFGYDPLFYYPPMDRTFGDLSPEEKFLVSHRGEAARQLFAWLEDSALR